MDQAASPEQPPVEQRPGTDETERKRTVDFFLGMLEQGEKFLLDEWKAAREAYAGSPEKSLWKRSNRFRRQVDTQQAYLHQDLARPRVVPLEGLANDPAAMKEAECDQAVLRYLSSEIMLKASVGEALKASQLTNLGILFHDVDRVRGVATVRVLKGEQVRWDGDCAGNLRRASWMAVVEYVSPEMLHIGTGYDLEKLKKAAQKTGEKERPGDGQTTISNYEVAQRVTRAVAKCKFVRFFARNEIALYDDEPKSTATTPDNAPHFERYLDEHGLCEPRRYLELVDGIDEPLRDDDEWPAELALDTDEWPISVLLLNDGEATGTIAAFTDYRHVQKINDAYDQTLKDIDTRVSLALVLKILTATSATFDAAELKRLLETDSIEVLKGLLSSDGKPLIQMLQGPDLPPALFEVLETLQGVGDEASSTNEIQMGGEGQEQETATLTQTRQEAATIATSLRLQALEDFEAEVYRKLLAMSHVISPRLSTVEIIGLDGLPALVRNLAWVRPADPEAAQALLAMGANTEVVATELLAQEDAEGNRTAELVEFGVEAMVGLVLAQYWKEKVPLAVSRRSCRVEVERGTSRLSERMDRFALMREVLATLLLPLYQSTGRLDLWIEAVKRILGKAGLSEFDQLVPPPESPVIPPPGTETGAQPQPPGVTQ